MSELKSANFHTNPLKYRSVVFVDNLELDRNQELLNSELHETKTLDHSIETSR